ncbi:MAG: ABC transporter permease [Alistipes sp.]|nr:ABC transporter permease [Alistipes sp.]
MMLNNLQSNDYFKLFVKRESTVVFGQRYSNLILLTIVLFVTFVAIAFSNGSLYYLSDKMNDPFTNWVNIEAADEGNFDQLAKDLLSPENMERFHYKECSYDMQGLLNFFYKDSDMDKYFRVRYFEHMNTDLVRKVLDVGNVIGGQAISLAQLNDQSLGIIVTADALKLMGYDPEDAPAYIYRASNSNDGAADLGFKMVNNGYVHTPIPVLAVVRKLPMNMDMIAPRYLKEQVENAVVFNMDNRTYSRQLFYFVPSSVEVAKFQDRLDEIATPMEQSDTTYYINQYASQMEFMRPFKAGTFIRLMFEQDSVSLSSVQSIDKQIADEFAANGVMRIYKYAVGDYRQTGGRYISVNFTDLDKIREFEQFARDEYQVKIEMSQVNAKENFNQVSVMANVLSWSMIVFSIVCIMLFIVNLLSSYFQKVKRNLGTFKAFGVSNFDLISVYMLIIFAMIAMSVVAAFALTMLIELLLPVLGILKDGEYNYLHLWRANTFISIVVIVCASVYTVYVVMSRLLRATPGDLIYDR